MKRNPDIVWQWRWALVLVVVLGLGLQSALVHRLSLRLPYPYDTLPIQALPEEYTNTGAFNATTSVTSPAEYANIHGAVIRELTAETTSERFIGAVHGAESVAVWGERLLMIDKYGFVRTAVLEGNEKKRSQSYELSNTSLYIGPGRSLGFHMLSASEAVVCDTVKGLLAVNLEGLDDEDGASLGDRIRVLTNSVSSSPWDPSNAINYANDLDIGQHDSHSVVYFSSSTTLGVVAFDSKQRYYDTMRSFVLTWLAGDISGRLLMYNMTSKTTTLLMQDLYYANGVALAADQSFVLVVETVGLRVWKYHLSGRQRGRREVFIDNLPGFPDGITRSLDGKSFYISLVAPLSPIFSTGSSLMQSPLSRWVAAWILVNFSPWLASVGVLKKLGCVLKVAVSSSQVQEVLLDPRGDIVSTISAVTETADELFFGNLGGESIVSWKKSGGD
jgi:hypothetical protein